MLRSALRIAGIVAANVAIFIAVMELAALMYFLLRDGDLYYFAGDSILRHRVAELTSGPQDASSEQLRQALREALSETPFRLNPYYGYNSIPDRRVLVENAAQKADMAPNCKFRVNVLCADGKVYFVTNNYGFDSVLDYPYRKESADEFVIGIFGDSFALGFVKATMPELFDDILAKVPQLSGKKITVLSFAREGFKQPQQLETLAYFLSIGQRFDLVINIDGPSSILHALVNQRAGIDYSMPSSDQTFVLRSRFATALRQETDRKGLIAYYFWKGVRERILGRMAAVPFAGPASVLDLAFSLAGRLEARALKASLAPTAASAVDEPVFMLPQKSGTTPAEAIDRSIEEWGRSSLLMSQMLRGLGIPYLHVLEPNQYFSKKPFSPAEARVAFAWDQWFAQPMRDGYPRLSAEGETLVKEGVDFVSAVDIYDNVAEPLYTDNCCHTNRVGLLLLGKFIAAHLPALR